MAPRRTAERSPLFKLIRNERGWYKHVPGVGTKYVCSVGMAPTGRDADDVFREKFPELSEIRSVTLKTMTVRDVLDLWLSQPDMAALSTHTLSFYKWVAEKFCEAVGPRTGAMRLTKSHAMAYRERFCTAGAPTTRKNRLVYAKQAMVWAADQGYVRPTFWEDAFVPPSQKSHRDHRAKLRAQRGALFYTVDDLHKLLRTADTIAKIYPMKLWTLLGINGGLGQSDIDGMTRHHYEPGRLVFPRPKTGIPRVIPLWPETERELLAWTAAIPKERDKLFTTIEGHNLHGAGQNNIVTKRFRELCIAADVKPRGHYSLRRTMRTLVDELPDRHAIDIVMGHEEQDMGRRYVQGVTHARLVAVTDHVRQIVMLSEPSDAESRSDVPETVAAQSAPRLKSSARSPND